MGWAIMGVGCAMVLHGFFPQVFDLSFWYPYWRLRPLVAFITIAAWGVIHIWPWWRPPPPERVYQQKEHPPSDTDVREAFEAVRSDIDRANLHDFFLADLPMLWERLSSVPEHSHLTVTIA